MEAPVLMSLCEELESGQNISRLILGQFIYSLYLTYFNLLHFVVNHCMFLALTSI